MSDASITSFQSKGQENVQNAIMPALNQMYDPNFMGKELLWKIPDMPFSPQMPYAGDYGTQPGVNYTGYNTPTYDVGGYNVSSYQTPDMYDPYSYNTPNAQNIMPTQDWYNNLSPEVMAGLNAPWNEARSNLSEQFGRGGMAGSPRGDSMSGAFGAAAGSLEAERAKNIGMQAWNMTQPGMMADYQAQLGRNQYDANTMNSLQNQMWQAELNKRSGLASSQTAADQNMWGAGVDASKWGAQSGLDQNKYLADLYNTQANQMRGEQQQFGMTDYAQEVARRQGDYNNLLQMQNAQAQQYSFPYTAMPGMLGGTYASPVVTPGQQSLIEGILGNVAGGVAGGLTGKLFG